MVDVINLEKFKDEKHIQEKVWATDEVMCLCNYRWWAVYDHRTPLNKFECPNCYTQGKVFKTGQDKEVLNDKK